MNELEDILKQSFSYKIITLNSEIRLAFKELKDWW